jgi:phospholipase C
MKNRTKNVRLARRAVVVAIAASLASQQIAFAGNSDPSLGGSHKNDDVTASPIKHVIVIVGENRTFDHVFATYVPPPGEHVDNLLSRGIVNLDGTPGPNYALAAQNAAVDNGTYSMAPSGKTPYAQGAYDQTSNTLQPPGTSYAFQACYTNINQAALDGPGCLASVTLAADADYGLDQGDLPLLTRGATGVAPGSVDPRIANYLTLPIGPYPLVTATGDSLYDTYGGSPVHRFYQMQQQLDCDIDKATAANPSGCQADLFTWVEETVSAGANGGQPKVLHEGNIAMGFYNVAKGDAPYLTELARTYTLNDNYHQPVMGGTFANMMMFGYAGPLYYADDNGDPARPPDNQIENPNPLAGTNNWYTQDGYGGGSYTNCFDRSQPAVGVVEDYLDKLHVSPQCAPGAYYLLNNYVPAYIGSGQTDPTNNGPFTLPPVKKQQHIGDLLSAARVSWAFFGERWNDFKDAPGEGLNFGSLDPIAYLYCNICNPFLYSSSVMTDRKAREQHNKDTIDLYHAIATGNLPAVSIVKPDTFNDGHPASSKVSLFESFTRKIIEKVQANGDLWKDTAILVTVDEGGGYYDSGYVQPVDYFGDGTRIPLIVVSKYSRGGHVTHEYSDHASFIKFIERNWGLPTLSSLTRDNLPNPQTAAGNPYVPVNSPAIGDLFGNFSFGQ